MAGYYTVQQGDYLSKIAKDSGFTDFHTIWDHPNNAQLKQARQNPNVLFPGDQVFVPDMRQRQESGSTERRHNFVIKRQPLKLRLVLEDIYEKPIANVQCALDVDGQVSQPTTTSEGKIEEPIPLDAQRGTLVVRGDDTPFENVPIAIKIGHLDPVEKVSGQIARLNNLGYFAGDLDDYMTQDGSGEASDGTTSNDPADDHGLRTKEREDQFRSAVEEFQCDHRLAVDGVCGPITQAKLKHVHGC